MSGISRLDELVGHGVPAPELERLRRVDALLRSLPTHERSREMNDSQHPTTRRILVVANGNADGAELPEAIRDRVGDTEAEVLVVAPAPDPRPRDPASNEDEAFGEAEARLRRCLARLDGTGIEANAVVGDADPLQAIADALQGFPADELVIATHPEARSPWLSRRVHVVVDRSRGGAGVWR